MIYYILANGNGYYIRKDEYSKKFVPVKNKAFAEKWYQRSKAVNILKNALPKAIRGSYKVVEICLEEKKCNESNSSQSKCLLEECSSDDQLDKWSSGIQDMAEFILDAEKRKEDLNHALSNIDREITDINHYIEFGKFNAYQGWKAFDMLQNRLRKRRKIKDEMCVLQQLGDCKISSSMLINIRNAIRDMSDRQYTPRALPELFK